MAELPIDAVMPQLMAAFGEHGAVVLSAQTGAGKTTRVPWALAQHSASAAGQVIVLEPRRLAARMAAERVASEQGVRLGGAVGYAVRLERKAGPDTRLLFMTEALLTRRFQQDPTLPGVSAVVLDELHERNLHSDLALALVAELRRRQRPDLRWLAMSATLDASAIAATFGAVAIDCAGRQYPVAIEHLEQPSREPLDRQIATSVRRLVREDVRGHILVFLPSLADIYRAAQRCEALCRDHHLALHLLHGRLPRAQQDSAVAPSAGQKLILATNIAESAITIDGVEAVVDSGLANVAAQHAWSSLGQLRSQAISQASAVQRSGRAGRTGPGRCLRLYTAQDFARRPSFDTPAIEQSDLCELVLTLHLAGADPAALRWLTPPPAAALSAAERLLVRLGALAAAPPAAAAEPGHLAPSPDAALLASLPLHPRHARALLEAVRLGVVDSAASAMALLAEQTDLRRPVPGRPRADSSLWQQLALLEELLASRRTPTQSGASRTLRARDQLVRLAARLPGRRRTPAGDPTHALMIAMLRGFPDRVARRIGSGLPKQGHPVELALADGGRAVLSELTSLSPEGLTLLLSAHERPNQPAQIHLAMPVSSDALLDAFADQLSDDERLSFDGERVIQQSLLCFGKLVLDDSRRPASPGEPAAQVLLAAIAKRGLAHILDLERWQRLQARLTRALPEPPSAERLQAILAQLCREHTSFSELRQRDILASLRASFSASERAQLQRLAPARIQLPSGRELPVQYPPDAPAFVEGYLQDFFGLPESPRLGATPLVLKLWAPNRRPLQVTDDLHNFWQTHYPVLRRQLSRRYPKHHFPDHPERATPALLKRHLPPS